MNHRRGVFTPAFRQGEPVTVKAMTAVRYLLISEKPSGYFLHRLWTVDKNVRLNGPMDHGVLNGLHRIRGLHHN